MKPSFLLFLFCLSSLSNFAQTGEAYYKRALVYAQNGELEQALALFDSSIAIKNDEYVAWYNRAIIKTMMGRYEDALVDLEKTIQLNPGYKKAYLNRGTAKKHLTDYSGALTDYTLALKLDSSYAEAYYDRGLVFELFDSLQLACPDFYKAASLGYANAETKIDRCKDPASHMVISILSLSKTAATTQYGFTSQNPVKVGVGPDGGIENERTYLDLLRDIKGHPVSYYHVASCCGYASPNAPKGLALLDKYEIRFVNNDGVLKSAIVYLTFYDYDEPMILNGFKTVKAH